MKKIIAFLIFTILLSSCNEYKQLRNGNIISPDKTEYTFFASEGKYFVFGERSFISHIRWQPKKLRHMGGNTDTGVYSFNNDPNLTLLQRVRFDSEWYEIYIKKELSENDYSFENCNLFKFVDTKNPRIIAHRLRLEYFQDIIGMYNDNDIKHFIEHIKNNEIFTDIIYNIRRNPFDEIDGDNGFIGYLFGFFEDIPYLVIPGTIWQKEDGTYWLIMDRRIFNISIDWLKKLGYNE
jgi:hypothetical protein